MTVWDGNRTSMLSPGSTTQREMKAVRLTSPAHAPRADHLPHCTLAPPRSQPIHLASGRAAQSRAISRYLGRSRGRAALSRAISERRSRGGTPAQKRKGPVGATGLTCSLGAPPHSGPVRRRPARRVHRPPRRPLRAPLILALLGLLSRSCRGTRRDSLPPTSDGSPAGFQIGRAHV